MNSIIGKITSYFTKFRKSRKAIAVASAVVLVFTVVLIVALTARSPDMPYNKAEYVSEEYTPPLTTHHLEKNQNQTPGHIVTDSIESNDTPEILLLARELISVKASSETDFGVAENSSFIITPYYEDISLEHLKAYFTARCGEPFTLTEQEGEGNGFLLSFINLLEPGRFIHFDYTPPEDEAVLFIFRVSDIFRVINTTPNFVNRIQPNTALITIELSRAPTAGFENFISIRPPIHGSFHLNGNVISFYPYGFDLSQLHTVTVSGELQGICGYSLGEDYIFSFNVNNFSYFIETLSNSMGVSASLNAPFVIATDVYETFLPWEEVYIAINIYDTNEHRSFTVELYEMPNTSDFVNFTSISNIRRFGTYIISIDECIEERRQTFFLYLNKTLPIGHYVARIRSTNPDVNYVMQKFIQVNPLAVYSLSVDGEVLVWLNSAITGEAVYGARVTANNISVYTDKEGIAILPISVSGQTPIIIEHSSYPIFAFIARTFAHPDSIPDERFYFHMIAEKSSNQREDIVNVFGVIIPRYGHSHVASDVFTLHIGNYIQQVITLDRFNSFAVSIPIYNLSGSHTVGVRVNDVRLMSTFISENWDTAPNLRLYTMSDRLAYFAGEYVEVEIFAINSETDQPVVGVEFRKSFNRGNLPTFRTDSYGTARIAIPIDEPSHWSSCWRPWLYHMHLSADSTNQMTGVSIIVAPGDIMVEGNVSGNTAYIQTHFIDLGLLDEYFADMFPRWHIWNQMSPNIFRGNPVDVDFTINVSRVVTEGSLDSESFDRINNRLVRDYWHSSWNSTVVSYFSINGRTVNGRAEIPIDISISDSDYRYHIIVRTQDSSGRYVEETIFDNRERFETESRHLDIQRPPIRTFALHAQSTRLRINESTPLIFAEGQTDSWQINRWRQGLDYSLNIPETGRALIVQVRNGIISTTVGSPGELYFEFTQETNPRARLFGAFFDSCLHLSKI